MEDGGSFARPGALLRPHSRQERGEAWEKGALGRLGMAVRVAAVEGVVC